MIDDKPNTDSMINSEDLITRLFAWIVEDPFYSTIHNSMVRVDDFSNMYHKWEGEWELHTTNLTDGMIRVLYKEWFNYNCQFSDFLNNCSAPNPNEI